MGAVVAEHEAGRVGDDGARLEEQRVGVAEQPGEQRRPRGRSRSEAAGVVLRLELVGEGRDRLPRVDAPAQRRVEQPERERAADAVRDRLPVAVDEVAARTAARRRSGTNGIARASERNGVPESASRRAAPSKAARNAVPQLADSPAWWISSSTTNVGRAR